MQKYQEETLKYTDEILIITILRNVLSGAGKSLCEENPNNLDLVIITGNITQ
jgi:hypothetical protein